MISSQVGVKHTEIYHLIAIQSPFFKTRLWVVDAYEEADRLPLKVVINQGIHDLDMENTHRLRELLVSKGNPMMNIEINDQNSWGNCSALLDEMRIYFFGLNEPMR